MARLYVFLEGKGIRFSKRSDGPEAVLAGDVTVVDVFGELPHYYSIAAAAYIGRNHTVLEPLRFKVPTVVAPRRDWDSAYVTYPAYMQLIEERGILECSDKSELGRIFLSIIESRDYGQAFVSRALALAERQKGAGARIVEHIDTMIG